MGERNNNNGKATEKKHTHTLERVKRTTENQKIFDAT